jgi:hypothetical protein
MSITCARLRSWCSARRAAPRCRRASSDSRNTTAMPRNTTSLIADSTICSSGKSSSRDEVAGIDTIIATSIAAPSASTAQIHSRCAGRGRRIAAIFALVSCATASTSPATFDSPESGKRSPMRARSRMAVSMIACGSSAR